MKFYVRFAKWPRVILIEKSSNKKIVRDKYIKWRDDVIVNSEEENCFSPKDLVNALGTERPWAIITEEDVKKQATTIKAFTLQVPNTDTNFEIHCHPDDLQKAIKEFSRESKGFLLSVGGHRYFVKKGKNLTTIPIYVVKGGKMKETPKALPAPEEDPGLPEEQDNFITQWLAGVMILLQARAGTGKTSTIIELANEILNQIAINVKRMRVAVFANKNSKEMIPKLPSNCVGSTWHVFGKSMFRIRVNGKPDGLKVSKIINNIPGYNPWRESSKEGKEKAKENAAALRELVGLIKNSILKPDKINVLQLIKHFGIVSPDPPEILAEHAIKVVDISDDDTKVIDFDDMIRFPAIYDWISPDTDCFISDEAQDNTPLRTHIMGVLMKMGCQVGGVGDDRQSIMGFAGADCESMKHIAELGLRLMPLTVNFRCGKNIIKEAQKLVPDIQAWDDSPDGIVDYGTSKNGWLLKQLIAGDSVVARRNNEILPICFQLIQDGKKATIQGRDFAEQIKNLINSFKASDIQDYNEKIHAWYEKQCKFRGEDEDSVSAEKFGVLKYFGDHAITLQDIEKKIDGIFSDDASEYKLSTAHRSKGLEWDRVFILNNANFKITRQKTTWGYKQEENLQYVAVTRAKKYLCFLD